MAVNALSVVKEVWVSLICFFSRDVSACGDVGCLYLHPSLLVAYMAWDETMCPLSMPQAGQ